MLQMTKTYNLAEITQLLFSNDLKDGTVFQNSLGGRMIVKERSLHWLTASSYISTVVAITQETITELWKPVSIPRLKKVTFAKGLERLEQGEEVTFVIDDGETMETVSSWLQLDKWLEKEVFIRDLYNGFAFVAGDPDRITTGTISGQTVDLANLDAGESATKVSRDEGQKLTRTDVFNIHHLKHYVLRSVSSIADQYNITERMVYYILDGTYWNDVYTEFHRDFDAANQDYLL